MYTDTSSTQLGSVITQSNRPLAFFSRKLSDTQQKYSLTEIELLTIVETLKEFKGMLWGQQLVVYTDHQNLMRDALGKLQCIGKVCALLSDHMSKSADPAKLIKDKS